MTLIHSCGPREDKQLTNEDYRLVVEFWRAVAGDYPRGPHEAEWKGEERHQKVSDALDALLTHIVRLREAIPAPPFLPETPPDWLTPEWREEFAEMLAERGVLVHV